MARNNAMILNLEPQGDIQIKSGNAKYKYKGDTVDQAQQKWKMKGECDTQVESFSEFTLMSINLGVGHDGTAQAPDQVTHTFTPNKVSRNGKRFKTRFQYYPDTREQRSKGGHHWPAFGKCFGKIGKDGKLKLWYGVWKAKEGGMMVMDGFDEIKAGAGQMESNKVSAAGFVHAGVQIGAEQHSVETMAMTQAKKNGAKLKVVQK
jgi:hypothetical protein